MARRNRVGNYGGLYGGDARGLYSSGSRRGMMIYGKPPRRWPKVLLAIVVILVVVGCLWQFACGGLPFLGASEDGSQQSTAAQQEQGAATDSAASSASTSTYQPGLNTQIQVSAVGDCTLGTDPDLPEDTNFTSVYNKHKASYFFERVTKYLSADNLTLANLEGPLTDSTDIREKSYNFKGDAKYAKILTKGSVEGVSLANDHAYDYGTEGYEDTKSTLSKNDILNFGYDRTATTEINGIKVGLYGINQLTSEETAEEQMKEDVASLKAEGCALVIGMFHWGTEGSHKVDSSQVTLAHEAVDEGTDLVLGSHPHLLQGVEIYHDRYICYSLGNFVYGGNDSPMETNTMIFQQTFTFQDGELVMDDATEDSIDVVPCSVSSSTTVNNYQPRPLAGSDAKKLLKALNGYSAKLKGTGVTFATELDDADETAKVE